MFKSLIYFEHRNYFAAFQNAPNDSSLYQRGIAFSDENSLDGFYADAANGTLPEVSWIFPPGALCEHPPNTPSDGAWFMKTIVDAVTHGPNWNSTILLICYDGKLRGLCQDFYHAGTNIYNILTSASFCRGRRLGRSSLSISLTRRHTW